MGFTGRGRSKGGHEWREDVAERSPQNNSFAKVELINRQFNASESSIERRFKRIHLWSRQLVATQNLIFSVGVMAYLLNITIAELVYLFIRMGVYLTPVCS